MRKIEEGEKQTRSKERKKEHRADIGVEQLRGSRDTEKDGETRNRR